MAKKRGRPTLGESVLRRWRDLVEDWGEAKAQLIRVLGHSKTAPAVKRKAGKIVERLYKDMKQFRKSHNWNRDS